MSFDRHAARFDRHAVSFDRHAARFDRHAVSFDRHAAKFDRHAVSFDRHAMRFDHHAARFDLRAARFARLVPMLFLGCGAAAVPPKGPGAGLIAANVVPPPGTALLQACTPTGPELCFNAIDDNCNGVIDEGCGEQTGLLQFAIAWGDNPADVNLAVVTPTQERIPNARGRSTPSGFEIGPDCPGTDGCGGQNVENVFFDGLEPPRGHYTVDITLVDLHGAEPPVKVHFGARLVGRTVGFDVELAPGNDAKKILSFDLP